MPTRTPGSERKCLLELFFLKEYKNSVAKKKLINIYYNFTNKINSANKFNLDEESLFMEFKSKLLNDSYTISFPKNDINQCIAILKQISGYNFTFIDNSIVLK